MKRVSVAESDYRRLARRDLASILRHKFLNEYGYDKGEVLVEAIVKDICQTIRTYYGHEGDLEPGQLIYPAASEEERGSRAKSIANTKLRPVKLTIVAEEDIEAIRRGAFAHERRDICVRRLTHEALNQGALLSQRDLALLLNGSNASMNETAIRLRKAGEFLPLRGYVADLGRFPSHKAAVVRLYLEGLLTPEIARRTYHSKDAVDRYIKGFERIRLLAPKFAREELPLLSGMSQLLVKEYLALMGEYRLLEEESDDAAHP